MTRATGEKKRRFHDARRRLARVESVIRERGWSEETIAFLMSDTGASRATIYRDQREVMRVLVEEEQATLPERRALFLGDLRRMRYAAKADGVYSAAARMLAMEAQVLGLDRVPLPEVEEPEGQLDTSLEAVLSAVRKLRRQAQAGHSYVAADRLLEREAALVNDIRLREEAKAAAERSHLTEAELVELVIENAARLPEQLRARLREALGG